MVDSKEENSDVIDFGILTLCDHLVLSHGSFGLWAALLSKSETDIMPFKSSNNSKNANAMFEETRAIMQSNFSNFIFMTD